jgi:hypothetical protein
MRELSGAFLATSAAIVLMSLSCSGNGTTDRAADADADTGPGGTDTSFDNGAEVSPVTVEPHSEKRGDFTIVWLRGTPYEMGHQHGELLHDTIGEAVEFVMADPLLSALPIMAKEMGIIDIALENSYFDTLEECQGLVDATADVGFTLDLCLTLNFGDVMLQFLTVGVPDEGPGCTGVIAAGEATADGVLLHSRNLDWGSMNIDIIHQYPVLFVRQPDDGLDHVYVGFPLNLSPYTGMNTAGISIGSHAADPAGIWELAATGRSHVQMVGQLLKTATTLAEVEEFIGAQDHMSAEMLVVADGFAGLGAVFEMTATGVAGRDMEDDAVYAVNHFVHPDMVAKHGPPAPGSTSRLLRLTQLIEPDGEESVWGSITPSTLAGVMRDITNPYDGTVPTLEELEALGWDNDGSIGANGPMHFAIFAPASGLFWVAAGKLPIHQQPYSCFSLPELLGQTGAQPCEPLEM